MKKYSILLGLTIFVITILFAGCAEVPEEPAVSKDPVTVEEPPVIHIDISEIDAFSVGQEVQAGNIVWEVTEVEDLGERIEYEEIPGYLEAQRGKFVRIEFFIQNTGEDSAVLYDLKAIDDKGRNYPICLEGFSLIGTEEACVFQEMVPGVGRSYEILFDILKDTDQLVLQVTDLELPPQEVAYIDLGI